MIFGTQAAPQGGIVNRIALAIALALAASTAAAQHYRWVDKDGTVHYTDTPPPATAKNVQKKQASSGPAEGPVGGYATQQAAKNFPVVLFTSEGCGSPCNDAKALLAKRGVPFREVTVGDDVTRDELRKISGALEVPVMTVGKDLRKGYEPDMYDAALTAAGYPTSAPPLPQNAPKSAPKAEPAAPAPKSEEPPRGRYSPL
jgi:glutaredoxin